MIREEPPAIVESVIRLGVHIHVDGHNAIRFRPKHLVSMALQERMASSRWAIVRYLTGTISGLVDSLLSALHDPAIYEEFRGHFEECAAVREFEQGNDRVQAELIAYEDLDQVIQRWLNARFQGGETGDGDKTPDQGSASGGLVATTPMLAPNPSIARKHLQ